MKKEIGNLLEGIALLEQLIYARIETDTDLYWTDIIQLELEEQSRLGNMALQYNLSSEDILSII